MEIVKEIWKGMSMDYKKESGGETPQYFWERK